MADDKVTVGNLSSQTAVDMSAITRADGVTVVDRQRIVLGDVSDALGLVSVDRSGNLSVSAGAMETMVGLQRAILRELQRLNFAIANISTESIYPDLQSDFDTD